MSPAFELEGVTVAYGRDPALSDVDLSLDFGSSLALVGPNGSGKTTVLNTLAGLVEAKDGRVVLAADLVVAYVRQQRGAKHWIPLTVDEVLDMGRYRKRGLVGRFARSDRAAVAKAATRLGVDTLGSRQFGELSGGQQQRVLVAQALAQEANLLLMDEPITGLDLVSQETILDVIEDETARGTAVVISTHNLDDEAHHCDQVALLANRLVALGSPEEVLKTEVLRLVYSDDRFEAHRDHDHPSGVLLLDDHHHHDDHD